MKNPRQFTYTIPILKYFVYINTLAWNMTGGQYINDYSVDYCKNR